MTSLTDSFRLGSMPSTGLAAYESAAAMAVAAPGDRLSDLAKAAGISVPSIDSSNWLPGRSAVARLAQSLSRRDNRSRTVAEELHEERVNAITHGLGIALSAAGLAVLLTAAMTSGGWLRIASCAVYGASLILMYLASTLMHAVQSPRMKLRLQLCDHVAIYLLIAGTYTPYMAALVQGFVGYWLLAAVWTLAALGIAIKIKFADRLDETSPLPCVGLGWLGLVAIKPLLAVLPPGGMALLVAGGVSYSAGVIFYCRDDKRYFHAIWHLFVLAGTALHFSSILLYIAR